MRKPIVIGLAAAAAAALFAGGAAYAAVSGGSKPTDPDRSNTHSRVIRPQAAIDSATETKFTSIAPCRAVDTRKAGGQLTNGSTRAFHIGGTLMFIQQGGTAGGCGIPANPVAVTATITTVARAKGYVTAYAHNATKPATSFMNYGTSFNASTGGIIPVDAASGEINVFNSGGPTQVIIDITGYYVKPLFASVAANGTLIAGPRVTGITHTANSGVYQLTFDRNLTKCAVTATQRNFGDTIDASVENTNGVFVHTYTTANADTDTDFGLSVIC